MKNKKILIVDFDNESSENLSKYLSGEGFEVSVAKDGQSGLERFNSEKPDLIILEPMLPKVHGFDLCKNLFQNARKKTPIVFLTEFYEEEQCKRETTQSEGDMAFFKKPYKSQEVFSSILKLLGNGAKEKAEDKTKTTQESVISAKAETVEVPLASKTPKASSGDMKNQYSEPQPPPEAAIPEEKKKPELPEEIDKMLKDTLSEFGMSIGIDERAPSSIPTPTEPSPQPQEPSLTPEQEKTEEKQEEKEEKKKREKKKISKMSTAAVEPAAGTEEEEKEVTAETIEATDELKEEKKVIEETVEYADEGKPDSIEEAEAKEDLTDKPKQGFFSGFAEETKTPAPKTFSEKFLAVITFFKKKPALKYVLPLVLAGLTAGGSALIFLMPKKGNSSAQQKVSQSFAAVQKSSKETQLANFSTSFPPDLGETQEGNSPDSAVTTDASEKQEQNNPSTSSPDTQEVTEEVKTASVPEEKPPATNPPPPRIPSPEYTEPVLPDSSVYQEIDVNPEIEAKAVQLDAKEETGFPGPTDTPKKVSENVQPASINTPAQIKAGDIVALSLVDTPPILIKRVQPKYPLSALSQEIEANVMVNVLISEKGEVEKAIIIRGEKADYGFNKASKNAVNQWRFKPAVKNGVKVKVWKPIMIAFKKNK